MKKSVKSEKEYFIAELNRMPENTDQNAIVETRARLERLDYSPMLLHVPDGFLGMDREALIREIEETAAWDAAAMAERELDTEDPDQIKIEQMRLLTYHYRQLLRLRWEEPEAWDEIDEMYGED